MDYVNSRSCAICAAWPVFDYFLMWTMKIWCFCLSQECLWESCESDNGFTSCSWKTSPCCVQ